MGGLPLEFVSQISYTNSGSFKYRLKNARTSEMWVCQVLRFRTTAPVTLLCVTLALLSCNFWSLNRVDRNKWNHLNSIDSKVLPSYAKAGHVIISVLRSIQHKLFRYRRYSVSEEWRANLLHSSLVKVVTNIFGEKGANLLLERKKRLSAKFHSKILSTCAHYGFWCVIKNILTAGSSENLTKWKVSRKWV